jgi:C4-dicarboxylate-specific signal transduction histidine kinase
MAANNIIADVQLEMVTDKELLEVSQEIIDETMYLSKTIDDFRDFFKPNKNKEEIQVEEVFEEAQKVMGKSFENSEITLGKNFTCSSKIETYKRELMQVFLNLLKNSQEALLEHRGDERKINVTCEELSNTIVFSISDNAGGIKEDIIGKIFDPYFSTKDEKVGTGLGLYMSKIIIEKHLKGTISVANKNDGVVFEIVLPKEMGQWDRRKKGGESRD